ncbi:metal ABC transporter permease [Corynebacterium sp.]|uniref:metal ABC transporter permease n=1 Tax=Corynebacterium sp. TaxID=1720 RepID=UPI002A918C7A|nr:metal ABC transporter permease [Corynebacterium sp.]MDY5785282.1 metal ABC transporter permease [Corynebacterium sp.]
MTHVVSADVADAFATTARLMEYDFVRTALAAAALLGILSGIISPLIVLRRMSFGVHATSELALMGAAAALFLGLNLSVGATLGSISAAIVLAALGFKGGNDAAVGVVMSFGMGLSLLMLHLYPGNSSTALALLTGQIVGVSGTGVGALSVVTVIAVVTVVALWRPLLFSSADPEVAAVSGVPVKAMAIVFAVLLGITAAQAVQIVGVLLVMALLITPGASAAAITSNPVAAVVWSVIFALLAAVGGVVLSLAPGLPVSVVAAFISFGIYLICRAVGGFRSRTITLNSGA